MRILALLLISAGLYAQSITLVAGNTIQGVAGTAAAVTYTIFGTVTSSSGGQVLAQGQLPNSTAALYTVPAGTKATINLIILANSTGSLVSGVILYVNGTTAANQIQPSSTLAAYAVLTVNGSGPYLAPVTAGTVTQVIVAGTANQIAATGGCTVTTTGTCTLSLLPTVLTAGTSGTFSGPAGTIVCTSTCSLTVPVPAAGVLYCAYNGDNVNTVITLAAIGSSARYENTARTAYGTAGTGTFVSGGAVGDAVCLKGLDSTHYLTISFTGTWVAS